MSSELWIQAEEEFFERHGRVPDEDEMYEFYRDYLGSLTDCADMYEELKQGEKSDET